MAADRAEIEQLIRAADAAGDADSVRVLFGELDKIEAVPQVQAQNPVAQQPIQQSETWGQAAKNVGEAGLKFATGITGGITGDAVGIAAIPAHILGQSVDSAMGQPMPQAAAARYAAIAKRAKGLGATQPLDPTQLRDRVQQNFTYQPSNPQSMASRVVDYPGKVIGGASDYLTQQTEKLGIPYLDRVVGALPTAAANILGVKAAKLGTFDASPYGGSANAQLPKAASVAAPKATPEQAAIRDATDAGYRLSPSQTGSKAGATAEGLSGQAASERLLSSKNVKVTDNLAKKALGITDDQPISRNKMIELKVKANKAYNDVAKTGSRKTSNEFRQEISAIGDRSGAGSFPEDAPAAVAKLKEAYSNNKGFTAQDAIDRIRQLRKDASGNLKFTATPEQNALGKAQRQVAEALDNELERHVTDLGKKELAAAYKAARVQLAKIHTVEAALQGTNISAKKIHQQWKKGAPLSGELLTIAKTYDSFDKVLQDAGKIRQKHPFSAVDLFVGAGGAALDPTLVGAVVARPLVRSAIASKAYQRVGIRPKAGARAATPAREAKSLKAAPAVVPRDENRLGRTG